MFSSMAKQSVRDVSASPLSALEQARENLAKAMFVDSYSALARTTESEREQIIERAMKRTKRWTRKKPQVSLPYAGSPYIMLNRKINSKGKIVK